MHSLHRLPAAARPEPARLTIGLGQYGSRGVKDENQDFHGSLVPDQAMLVTKGIAVALADGISTSALGAVAAETAVKTFLTDYYSTSEAWSVQNSAERVISATNSWMHAQNARKHGPAPSDHQRESGMICTFSALILKSRTAHLFHVGDSRIARLSGTSLEPLTEAHRVELGGGESYLARALGVNRAVEIDYCHTSLAPGDIFVLTTDGVHDHVRDKAVAEMLLSGSDLDKTARAIAEAALAAGSRDNVTVQIVRIDALPDSTLDDVVGGEGDLPPAPILVPGQTFEGYAIIRELHSGSRSHVYLARDVLDGARVALKVPSTDHAADPAQIQALMLEEWIARRVSNTHVLKAPPVRQRRAHAYVVTDYVEGQTLNVWMHDHPRPDLIEGRALIKQIAAGLQALHRKEILHRDLRPANILVDAEGTARIIDFGSAQVAGLDDMGAMRLDAQFAGTVQYSAPELYLGQSASRQSDIFSLGVIAYQMLTGTLPYGPRLATAMTRAAQKKLRYLPAGASNHDIPDWLDATLAKALSVDPAERYQELSEFVYDLEHPNSALTAPDPRPFLQRRPERIWQMLSALLFLILFAMLLKGA